MVLTPSTMLELGTKLPSFRLPDYDGRVMSDQDVKDAAGVLVVFASVHCPFVKLVQKELGRFGDEYVTRGLAIVAIGANDTATHPADGPAGMKVQAAENGWHFPYLYDESQQVAQAFRAACTPDYFLFDRNGELVYRGQFDNSRPGNNIAPTGDDLRAAADSVLAGRAVAPVQKPSIGCNIKWKAGHEPAYFNR